MLNVAIHGMGNWGRKLVESVQGSSKIRFVCGVTRNPAAHVDFAARNGLTLVTSYADTLADKDIGAVVLATPHSQHEAQVIQAARAGKPVCVEKPITLTQASAQRAVDACKAAGVTLGLGFNRRYAPGFVEMMRRIRAGEIGDVLHVEGHHAGPTGYLGVVFVTAELYRVHVFGSKGWLEMRGDTELVSCALEGKPQRETFDAVNKERAVLEAFADAVAAGQPFMVPPKQAVNGIAVLESIEVSARTGAVITIKQ